MAHPHGDSLSHASPSSEPRDRCAGVAAVAGLDADAHRRQHALHACAATVPAVVIGTQTLMLSIVVAASNDVTRAAEPTCLEVYLVSAGGRDRASRSRGGSPDPPGHSRSLEATSVGTTSTLHGGVLGVDDCDRGDIRDIGDLGASTQHVHRLVHAHQDRADRQGAAEVLQ
jgi:hypothetical protein